MFNRKSDDAAPKPFAPAPRPDAATAATPASNPAIPAAPPAAAPPSEPPSAHQTAPPSAADTPTSVAITDVDPDSAVLIGKGARIVGEISNCARIEIQGTLEGTLDAGAVVISDGGMLKGKLKAKTAEVHGMIDGEVVVDDLLDVRATGRVLGELTYGQIAVAAGGNISGNVRGPGHPESKPDSKPASKPTAAATPPSTPASAPAPAAATATAAAPPAHSTAAAAPIASPAGTGSAG